MKKKKIHTIVISFDSVSESDFTMLKSLPNCRYLLEHGSFSTKVQSIYPTVTYPVHTSIITGCYPDQHGIYHNHHFDPTIKNDKYKTWHWYHDEIKVPTLMTEAIKQKRKIGAIFWPVTGNAKIAYNLPEIIALPGENQTLKILKAGSKLFLLRNEIKYRHLRKGIEEPFLADFATKVTCDMIIRHKPDITFLHLVSVDTLRHKYGVTSNYTEIGLKQYDQSLGEILTAIRQAGLEGSVNIFITTDHGQIDVKRYGSVNAYLIEYGLQSWSDSKLSYQVFAQSIGFGAYLHFNYANINDIDDVLNRLNQACQKMIDDLVISRYDTNESLMLRGCSEPFDASVEAYPNTYLTDSIYHEFGLSHIDCSVMSEDMLNQISYDTYLATHGYDERLPGYKTIFIGFGPQIKENFDIGPMHIVDIAPTIATLSKIDFPPCDGKVLTKIIKEEV